MAAIDLKEILIKARQESHRMRHFYIGVEHIFIALLDVQGGLTRSILEEQGLTPDYLADAIRRKVGKGSQRRLWAGTPSTPRANVIIDIATDIAIEDGRSEANERDVLTAIIEENDNMPMRIVKSLGVNTVHMHRMARTRAVSRSSPQAYVTVDFGPDFDHSIALSDEQLLILRRMFNTYVRIRVEYGLSPGLADVLVLIVIPMRADNREEAALAVKIAATDHILDETQRYETLVKALLPASSARLEDRPIAPEASTLAGLCYSLPGKAGHLPQDLRAAIADTNDPDRIGFWLRQQLFAQFGRTWWQQRHLFKFQVWTEYDWLLPPILRLNHIPDSANNSEAHLLRVPLNRARLNQIGTGDSVTLENFTVQDVNYDTRQLTLVSGRGSEVSKRAHKVEINDIDLSADLHYRGEVVERISGQVEETRHHILRRHVDLLDPPFDLEAFDLALAADLTLPNPLVACEELLYFQISGAASKIHGDLHLGNILIGASDSVFLIDFEHVRDGHSLFDWAALEISLWNGIVLPEAGTDWESLYPLLDMAAALNRNAETRDEQQGHRLAWAALIALRDIVATSLALPNNWSEYYVALALCALRAVCAPYLGIPERRFMFLLSALAVAQLDQRHDIDRNTDD